MAQSEDMRNIKLTLILYVVIAVIKLVVFAVTGVIALFAEGLHTVADVVVSAFLLAAAAISRRKADSMHMFGYERAQNVAALVAATLFISFTSFKLYEEAIPRLFSHHEATYQYVELALGVIVLSMLIAAAPLFKLFKQKERGAAAKAQFMELINDEMGLLAALIGTLLVMDGHPLGDPLAAMAVATIIAINAIGLFRENLSYLLGQSPEPETMARIRRVATSIPGVLSIHNLRAEQIGPSSLHGSIHVVIQCGTPIEEAARIAEEVDQRVHDAISGGYFIVRVDASDPEPPAQAVTPKVPAKEGALAKP